MKNLLTLGSRPSPARLLSSLIGGGYYAFKAEMTAARDILYEFPGRLFDVWHGVDTCGTIHLPDLLIPEPSRSQARHYQPTKIAVFLHLIQQLPIVAFGQFAFVDFGCGKGRCLLLAAQAGFGKVVGVELSEHLCDAARGNAVKFMSGLYTSKIDVHPGDAGAAALPEHPSVYFFYNPFGEHAMEATLRHIDRHLTLTRQEAFVIYVNPMHPAALAEGGFRPINGGRRQSEDWTIWHRPAAASGALQAAKAA